MSTALDYVTTPTVFRHTKRTQWGLGRVMSEGPHRRNLQFEDGHRRTIKRGYYHLLERVDRPDQDAKRTLDTLVEEAREAMGARATKNRRTAPAVAPGVAFEEQVVAFRALFTDGFRDAAWKSEVRGAGAKRALKRHRDVVAEAGPKVLGAEALRARLEAGEAQAAFEEMVGLLQKTDLAVVKTDVKPLKALGASDQEAVMQAVLRAVESPDASPRIDDLLSTLQRVNVKPTWTLLSALMTLSDPRKHGPVRSSLLRAQAKRLNIELTLPNPPSGRSFLAAQAVLDQVAMRLGEAGFEPADRIDVSEMVARSLAALKTAAKA